MRVNNSSYVHEGVPKPENSLQREQAAIYSSLLGRSPKMRALTLWHSFRTGIEAAPVSSFPVMLQITVPVVSSILFGNKNIPERIRLTGSITTDHDNFASSNRLLMQTMPLRPLSHRWSSTSETLHRLQLVVVTAHIMALVVVLVIGSSACAVLVAVRSPLWYI